MNYRLTYIVINSENVYLHSRSSPVSYLPHLTPQVSNKAKKNPWRVLTVFTLPAFILLYRDFHFPECKPPRAQISNDYCYKLWMKHRKQRLRTLKSKREHVDYGGQSPTGWVSWLRVPLLTVEHWRQAPVQISAAKAAKTPVETLPSLRPGEPEQVQAWGSCPRGERAEEAPFTCVPTRSQTNPRTKHAQDRPKLAQQSCEKWTKVWTTMHKKGERVVKKKGRLSPREVTVCKRKTSAVSRESQQNQESMQQAFKMSRTQPKISQKIKNHENVKKTAIKYQP